RRAGGWPRRHAPDEQRDRRARFAVAQEFLRHETPGQGLEAIYPKPKLSGGNGHKVYPYLLRDVAIDRPDQVWSTDITYVGLPGGFTYLAAVIDWHSRFVLSWELSNTLDGAFCLDALEAALSQGKPEVFNTDQAVQFTVEV